jgi:hypothetical protein
MATRRAESVSASDLSKKLKAAVQSALKNNPGFAATARISIAPRPGILGFRVRSADVEGQVLSKLTKVAGDVTSQVPTLAAGSQPALLVQGPDIVLGFFPDDEVIEFPE